MITALLQEAGPAGFGGDGGGNGGGDGGGRRNLEPTIMQEHVKEMEVKIRIMQQEIDNLKKENMELKNQNNNENKEQRGGGNKGKWGEGRWWANDPWKKWNGRDATTEADDTWGNDDGKGGQNGEGWRYQLERDEKDEWETRVWRGGRIDRRNEMVARGFKRNTYWKEIKSKVEEVMGKSRVTNGGVKVIGQMASFAIIRFDSYENKQEFKHWLQTHGEEVKRERGIWFGDNADADTRARERAVGKVKRALFLAREARTDVYRDYRRGMVYVGDEVVAKWDGMAKMMTFRGEGREIRGTYKKLMEEGKRDEDPFSE
jgi:hypothetical protein